MSDINSFTHYKVFKPEERGFGRVRLDISKRKYDNRWVVWQKMLSILVDGTFENVNVGGSEYSRYLESNHRWIWSVIWVPVEVAFNKSKALKYCRARFGEDCFNENVDVKITFATD